VNGAERDGGTAFARRAAWLVSRLERHPAPLRSGSGQRCHDGSDALRNPRHDAAMAIAVGGGLAGEAALL